VRLPSGAAAVGNPYTGTLLRLLEARDEFDRAWPCSISAAAARILARYTCCMDLLEREQQLQALNGWFAAAAAGSGCVALLIGEAGIGKTSLLRNFADAHAGAARVLWGACDALFTPRPLAPLHDIARQTSGPLLAALTGTGSREAIFLATLQELERAGPPTVVIFEDVHWADEATLDLLKFLGRRVNRTRAMLIASFRDDEVGARHPLRFVIGDLPRTSVHRLTLDSLSEPAVAELARRAGRFSHDLYNVTAGNPFFVTEVLATTQSGVPASVRDAVLARASRLSPSGREIAELVCIMPGRAERWLLERVSTLDPAGIEGCLAIGMVRGSDGSLSFRHELARRALEDSLPTELRRELHARVLRILANRAGASHAELVHHASGSGSSEDVLVHAPAAAAEASAVGAHREAVSYYRTALAHAGNLPLEVRVSLLEKLAFEYYVTDEIAPAVDAYQAALEGWRARGDSLKAGDTLRWLSRMYWHLGRKGDAERYATEAIETLEPLARGAELAMAYSNRAQLAALAHHSSVAIEWANKAVELAESLGNGQVLSHALNNLGVGRINRGDDAGWCDLERSLEVALDHGLQEHAGRAYVNLSTSAVIHRRYVQARSRLEAGIAYCEARDLDIHGSYMLAFRARLRFEHGDWTGACEDAEAVLRRSRAAMTTRMAALIVLGHVRVRRGDPGATEALEEARELAAPTRELQRIAPLAVALAEAAELRGDREQAIQAARFGYELTEAGSDPWTKGGLAIRLWRAGALREPPADVAQPYALEAHGEFSEAARAWEALGCPYEEAESLASSGEEAAQRQALAIFERLGAAPAAQALRREMRGRGIRKVPRGARHSTRGNPHGLTTRQMEILKLLGEGLRNAAIAKRLFLTTRTVDHHVSAILSKLGVASRAEAAIAARDLLRK
jgi:DNA-binding CsgD family transcriptional regulator